MAYKSISALDIETSAFDKFKQSFDKYSEKLSPARGMLTSARFA